MSGLLRPGQFGCTYIAAANPRELDVHDDIVGAFELWDRAVLELHLVNSFENERGVLNRSLLVFFTTRAHWCLHIPGLLQSASSS